MEVDALLARLHGVLGELAAADVSLLSGDELVELTEGLQRESSRLGVVAAGAMSVWEASGVWRPSRARTAGLALGNRVARCHHVVAAELGRAAKLARWPRVREAVLEGRLSMDHVDLFARYATEMRWGLFLRDEGLLVDACAGLRLFADARKLVRYWADHADDELGLASRLAVSEVELSRSRDTGELSVRGHLAPIDAEQVAGELDRLCREIRLEDRAAGIDRSAGQRRAVALVRMAARSAGATGATPRPLFQVIIGADATARLCELASGAVVRPEDLVPFIDSAVVESFLFDEAHRLLGVSGQRTFTGRLRRAVQVRDRRCRHESGCPVPATDLRSDIDHVRPWAAGGPTTAANGRVLCTAHNRHEHLHGPPVEGPAPPEPEPGAAFLEQWRRRERWRVLQAPYIEEEWTEPAARAG